MVAFASSLDQGGALARTAEDLALVLDVMAGFDPRDSTSVDRPKDDYAGGLGLGVKGLRIGVPREYFSKDLAPDIAAP
jgi:aspartyl-tRNA(Asn)/glutamyl-tRNA(Gln) amidotransferase subunit A